MSKSSKDPEARQREQQRREKRRDRRAPDREYEDTLMASTDPLSDFAILTRRRLGLDPIDRLYRELQRV